MWYHTCGVDVGFGVRVGVGVVWCGVDVGLGVSVGVGIGICFVELRVYHTNIHKHTPTHTISHP